MFDGNPATWAYAPLGAPVRVFGMAADRGRLYYAVNSRLADLVGFLLAGWFVGIRCARRSCCSARRFSERGNWNFFDEQR